MRNALNKLISQVRKRHKNLTVEFQFEVPNIWFEHELTEDVDPETIIAKRIKDELTDWDIYFFANDRMLDLQSEIYDPYWPHIRNEELNKKKIAALRHEFPDVKLKLTLALGEEE